MLKIYLAAPFENDAQVSTLKAVENEFDKYGFDYFSPRKSGVVPHLSPRGQDDRIKARSQLAADAIECDFHDRRAQLLANRGGLRAGLFPSPGGSL